MRPNLLGVHPAASNSIPTFLAPSLPRLFSSSWTIAPPCPTPAAQVRGDGQAAPGQGCLWAGEAHPTHCRGRWWPTFGFRLLPDQLKAPSIPCTDPAAGPPLETRSNRNTKDGGRRKAGAIHAMVRCRAGSEEEHGGACGAGSSDRLLTRQHAPAAFPILCAPTQLMHEMRACLSPGPGSRSPAQHRQ